MNFALTRPNKTRR